MTKSKVTKRALLSSILSILLCFTMLLGTTFAWFTDSVTSANNIIKSGNLDIVLEYYDAENGKWVDVKGSSDILTGDLWEPGYTDVAYLRFKNAGSLALKYQLGVQINEEVEGVNRAGDPFKLSDYIYYDVIEDVNGETQAYANRADALAAVVTGEKLSVAYAQSGTLAGGTTDAYEYLAVVVYMPETVGNEANHNGVNVPKIDLGINILATQLNSEEDSFGPDYDADAEYPVDITVSQNVNAVNDLTTEAVTLTYANEVLPVSKVEAVVPAGVKLEAGTTKLALTVKEASTVNAGVAAVLNGNQAATTYEIDIAGVADDNTEAITITLNIEKGLIDVVLYHNATEIPCTYDPTTGVLTFSTEGFSPFTVVSTEQVFAKGEGTAENPYIIEKAEDLLGISKYYHEYKYYKVADGVETLDLNGIGNLSLNGSFDGNGVKIVNLNTSLFTYVGNFDEVEIKISNMDVTMHATNGRAFVRNIFNVGNTIFENVALHGYLEGQYNLGSFYNYGTANSGSSDGADYTVSFVNATSDMTIVCTTGNSIGGMLGHGYEGANYQLSINMDENSKYTGKMYTTGTATCYQVMALCSHATYILNGVETSRTDYKYDSTKLAVSKPVAGENGYTVVPVEGVAKYVVYVNAQLTAYDKNGEKIANLSGMTGNLGNFTLTDGFDGKIFDLVNNATIVNGPDHNYSYEMNGNDLTVYTGRTENYASGWITLQVNQYDAEGNLLATGIVTAYTVQEPVVVSTADELKAAIANGGNIILKNDIELDANETIIVSGNVLLNLNGHNINGVSTLAGKNRPLFTVKGEMTVVGNGNITLKHTGDNMEWNNLLANFSVEGGALTLCDGVVVVNNGGTDMAYAVDVNTTLGKSVLNVNGATLESSYVGVRIFNNHKTEQGIVNYNSGVIEGHKNGYDIWAQLMSQPAENAVVNIAEGIVYTTEEKSGMMYYVEA